MNRHEPSKRSPQASTPENVTRLLNTAAEGDADAAREVYPFIYRELRKLAGAARRRLPAGDTMQVTALVNEAYLRIADKETDGWKARAHFFFAASRAMRDILVEDARRKRRIKHGGALERADADEVDIPVESSVTDILALNLALEKLETTNPEGFRIAMLRYFAGLTVPEVAESMGMSVATVERRWTFLRAWFAEQLNDAPNP